MFNYIETKERYHRSVDERLADLLSGKTNPPNIYEAISYSLLGGGKRMRPILLLGAFEAASTSNGYATSGLLFESRYACALDFACAIEMIHNYSLIHDDLPALDNDDLRRGRPTNHKVFGEAMAILAGDALLNMAYELMIEASSKHSQIESLPALAEVSSCAGIKGMIGGQVMDIHTQGTEIDGDTLHFIHEGKTAALTQAAVTAGAIIGGATGADLHKFRTAGRNMGLAFQIMDDILDVTGDETKLGKRIGSDKKNAKNTYVSLFGLKQAMADYSQIWDNCVDVYKDLDAVFLTAYMINNKSRVN